jgi:deazaflavin-dependent oxidoreductase (nitroreductase family)
MSSNSYARSTPRLCKARSEPDVTPRLGRRMARFNRQVTNRLTRPLARWLPGFGVIEHRGRRTGRRYETPVNVFPTVDGYLIALTYGTEAEWARNVLAADGCQLTTRRRRHRLGAPTIVHDKTCRLAPRPLRPILALLRVADFLRLKTS